MRTQELAEADEAGPAETAHYQQVSLISGYQVIGLARLGERQKIVIKRIGADGDWREMVNMHSDAAQISRTSRPASAGANLSRIFG